MPRPTAAQLAYGTATVICCTLAMLLLSQTSSGIGVAVIALAALGLGLLVAVTVPLPKSSRHVRPAEAPGASTPAQSSVRTTEAATARIPEPAPVTRRRTASAGLTRTGHRTGA
ncbi:hypothetical protein ACFVT5_04115 [Streptomyces sp. NPDC058001]|uniref:hypothetical protein n=1 Tax=Streptomyces sp. NPDC058001 TaxID=3346300 RepID=UPI0036EA2C2F